jgi:hypothetical protein
VERQICAPLPTIHARPSPSIRTLSRSPSGADVAQSVSLEALRLLGRSTATQSPPPFVVRTSRPLVPTASPTIPSALNSMSRNTTPGPLYSCWKAPPTRR